MIGGDVSFSGVVQYHVSNNKCTYEESFSRLKPVFKRADFRIINFESPIGNLSAQPKHIPKEDGVYLLAEKQAVKALQLVQFFYFGFLVLFFV